MLTFTHWLKSCVSWDNSVGIFLLHLYKSTEGSLLGSCIIVLTNGQWYTLQSPDGSLPVDGVKTNWYNFVVNTSQVTFKLH